MKEAFVKKYWDEEDILFYLHFEDNIAVEQIEITAIGKKFLSIKNPIQRDSMLYDQTMDNLEVNPEDFITKEEFEKAWQDK